MDKKEIVKFYLENGVLISPDMLDNLEAEEIPLKSDFIVATPLISTIVKNHIPLAVKDFETSIVMKEKNNSKMFNKFLDYINENIHKKIIQNSDIHTNNISSEISGTEEKNIIGNLEADMLPINSNTENLYNSEISPEEQKRQKDEFMKRHRIRLTMDYDEKIRKRTVQDFVSYFNSRYKELERILRQRQELSNVTSIGKVLMKKEKDNVAVIGYVYEKALTKANNIMLTIEDPTGFIKVVISQKREEVYSLAQEIQLDEVIGVTGLFDNILFANNLLLPDIPLTKELKKTPEEGYFVVISDPQVGNKLFLEKEFKKFISWINGDIGNDLQRDIASKVKYIFIVGDLVDGVGIYPDQEYDLTIIDIKDQYNKFTEYIKEFPKDIPIFICPGNHDVGRISEPQPRFHDEYTKVVTSLHNVIPVSNPSLINIFFNPEFNFEGFDVLLYHGYSFVFYSYTIPSIRQAGGQKRPDLIMRYLLQRRHLAPTHTSTLYIPEPSKDYLAINVVPDFFFSGHIHRSTVSNYRNITCINASCWVSKSDEQERRGLEPQPGRAFIINMQTREVKMMNFLSKEEQEKEDSGKTSKNTE